MNKCSITFGLIAVLNVIAVTTASKKRVIHTMVIEILHHFVLHSKWGGHLHRYCQPRAACAVLCDGFDENILKFPSNDSFKWILRIFFFNLTLPSHAICKNPVVGRYEHNEH